MKNCDIFESHMGKGRPFRSTLSGWIYSDLFWKLAGNLTREALATLVQGVLVVIYGGYLSPYRDHSTR